MKFVFIMKDFEKKKIGKVYIWKSDPKIEEKKVMKLSEIGWSRKSWWDENGRKFNER